MEIQENDNGLLKYDKVKSKIKRTKLALRILYVMLGVYMFLLLFYLMIVHNAKFQLSYFGILVIGYFISSYFKGEILNLKDDLDDIIEYNKENKVE